MRSKITDVAASGGTITNGTGCSVVCTGKLLPSVIGMLP